MNIIDITFILLSILSISQFWRNRIKGEPVEEIYCKLSLACAVLIPVFYFALLVPSIIVTGERDLITTVTTSDNENINAVVTFDIEIENSERSSYVVYYPTRIKWYNGEISEAYSGYGETEGSSVIITDQFGRDFLILIPEASFSYREKLAESSLLDKVIFSASFIASVSNILSFFAEEKKNHNENL